MSDIKREKEILNVNINDIIPNRFQPRLNFDDDSMQELAQSILEHGIIQPLVVRRVSDKYEIIAGERRYKASTIAAIPTVPVIVVDLNDTESAEVALIENIQRKDLTPIEEAKSYQKIIEMGQTTQEILAKRMGKSQSAVSNKIRLLTLNKQVQDALMRGEISERHARSLLSIKEDQDQINMLNRIIEERLTVRKTDKAIEEFLNMNGTSIMDEDIESLDLEEKTIPLPPSASVPETPSSNILTRSSVMPINSAVDPEIKPNIDFLLKSESDLNTATSEIEIPSLGAPVNVVEGAIPPLPNANEREIIGENTIAADAMLKPDPNMMGGVTGIPDLLAPSSVMSNDYKTAVSSLRENIKTLQKYGTKIDSEEFDFENFFQINIKLDKK